MKFIHHDQGTRVCSFSRTSVAGKGRARDVEIAEPPPRTLASSVRHPSSTSTRLPTTPTPRNHNSDHHNGIRVENCRPLVRSPILPGRGKVAIAHGSDPLNSYNRYIAVASRAVRRSLKEDKRIAAERRGESELKFAKWTVCTWTYEGRGTRVDTRLERQAGRGQEPQRGQRCFDRGRSVFLGPQARSNGWMMA